MKRRVYIYSFILLIIDIISKLIVKNNMVLNQSIKIIPNFFNLTYVLNDGAAFSILRGKLNLLIILGLVIFIGIIYYLNKERLNNYKIVYYSLLIGGLLGNLIDRIIYNAVIDFLDFNILGLNFPIFNLADTFICVSIGLIIIEGIVDLYGNKSR
ncbi:MAG: signal peptidase II [Bacilli bacterium]|nr:signal peptidase II [Bacilli bacterium]